MHEEQQKKEYPDHAHDDHEQTDYVSQPSEKHVLTVRSYSGLSGDMFLAGLLKMADWDAAELDTHLAAILPELAGTVQLVRREVNHIGGWHVTVNLPHAHEHRTLQDILDLIDAGGMPEKAKVLAAQTFTLLATAEAAVHGKKPAEIHFHEVGALDSILDICLSCDLFLQLAPDIFAVSPLPIADGQIICAHGIIPTPAPAVVEMLAGIPVRSFPGEGETLTPTAVALLHTLSAVFGSWPDMYVRKACLVYGDYVFPHTANGVLFAFGEALSQTLPEKSCKNA